MSWIPPMGFALSLGVGAMLLAAPALSLSDQLPALSGIQRGLWQLRDLDNPNAQSLSICVADPAALLHPRQQGARCSTRTVSSSASQATVTFECAGGAYGRTSLRVETSRLVQIHTQGIDKNTPFALRAEARRSGAC